MTLQKFIETYCRFCGTQHCEGPDSEWFEGCSYKDKLSKPSDYLLKIIRCKDCQMWRSPSKEDISNRITTGYCINARFNTEPFDFCSDAIRR